MYMGLSLSLSIYIYIYRNNEFNNMNNNMYSMIHVCHI